MIFLPLKINYKYMNVCIVLPDQSPKTFGNVMFFHMIFLGSLLKKNKKLNVRLIEPSGRDGYRWDHLQNLNMKLDFTFDNSYSFIYNQNPYIWQAYELLLYLQKPYNNCDILHVTGLYAFFVLMAKRQHIDFMNTRIVFHEHDDSKLFSKVARMNRFPSIDEWKIIHMEMQAKKFSDSCLCLSDDLSTHSSCLPIIANRSVYDLKETQKLWIDFHQRFISDSVSIPHTLNSITDNIVVEVVITTFNPDDLLLQAVQSIQIQSYSGDIYILIVDDSSHITSTFDLVNCSRIPCRILCTPHNLFLGGARNFAIRNLKKETTHVLFMDDDNIAKPEEIVTLVNAARHSKAEIYTMLFDEWTSHLYPSTRASIGHRWLFLACSLTMVVENDLGDANMFVDKQVFQKLMFTETRRMYEDWEFLNAAVLKNISIELVPYALFWKRSLTGRGIMNTNANIVPSLTRMLEPFKYLGWPVYATALLASSSKSGQILIDKRSDERFRRNGEDNVFAEYAHCGQYDWKRLQTVGRVNGRKVHKLRRNFDFPFVGRYSMHPWRDSANGLCHTVAWTYYTNEPTEISVTIHAFVSQSEGDGVTLHISYGSNTLCKKKLFPDHLQNRSFFRSFRFLASVGKPLRFFVHPNNSPYYDELYFKVHISSR